jgi:hypothetical protein
MHILPLIGVFGICILAFIQFVMTTSRSCSINSWRQQTNGELRFDLNERKTMKQNQYFLLDCEQMHVNHPETFEIPGPEDIQAITVGSCVKVIFMIDEGYAEGVPERMWVIVDAINGDEFVGRLNSEPYAMPIRRGEVIEFNRKHICQVFSTRKVLLIQYRDVKRQFVVEVPTSTDIDDREVLSLLSEEADERGVGWQENDGGDLGEIQVLELGKDFPVIAGQDGMINIPCFVLRG